MADRPEIESKGVIDSEGAIEVRRALASAWLAIDPDAETAAAISAALEADDDTSLGRWFDGRIAFGTAGLRAEMAPGPTGMNRLVVRQTTAGLVAWLAERSGRPTLVVGHDARHRSAVFAADVAEVAASHGATVLFIDRPEPTPVVAHELLRRGADAAVVITASHNPPADNGYKLYLGDGVQLSSPADAEISARIDRVVAETPEAIGAGGGSIETVGTDAAEAHRASVVAALGGGPREVTVVYSAMHGVGGAHVVEAMAAAGFAPPIVVDEQFSPDPDFPTVAFPNPEEDGAMDLALDLAERVDADVVVANDPDADRLAVAVVDAGAWRRLSGDEVGSLLAAEMVDRHVAAGGGPAIVSSSLVSSSLIDRIAEAGGVEPIRTLTGFKWIARPIVDRSDATFLFGYEEALGYCVGDLVRDKDGISALLVVLGMVAADRAVGRSLTDRLDDLALRHGWHRTRPVTIRFDGEMGLQRRSSVLSGLVASPPTELGGLDVIEVVDLSAGGALPPTPGLVLRVGDARGSVRAVIRPSGTEPKLKAYLETVEAVADESDLDASRGRADDRLARVADALGGFMGA